MSENQVADSNFGAFDLTKIKISNPENNSEHSLKDSLANRLIRFLSTARLKYFLGTRAPKRACFN